MLPEMKPFRFEVGVEVKDLVTGFKGIIVTRSQYLTGCNRYGVQSKKVPKEGKPADWVYFDEDQITEISRGIAFKRTRPAGPVAMDAPQR